MYGETQKVKNLTKIYNSRELITMWFWNETLWVLIKLLSMVGIVLIAILLYL